MFPEILTRRKVQVNTKTGETKYYSKDDPETPAGLLNEAPVTLTNTTFEEFSWYVRRGYPVVVNDMARDWPMKGWECEDFAREFPDGEMKGEYGGGRVILGERDWMGVVRDAGQHIDGCDTKQCNDRDTKPHAAPHVWHVKDEEPYATRHRVQKMFRVPYFMEESFVGRTLNKPDVNESLEFWLSPPGAGAFAHADAYCTMTASVQLNGHKRWRMMNPGPQVDSIFDRYDTQDSGIYRVSKWDPEFEFMVPSGGGVIFPPYNIHETVADTRQCTTATTFNFFSPQPTRYIRAYLPRLLNTHLGYNEQCSGKWDRYATFINTHGYRYHRGKKGKTPTEAFEPSLDSKDIETHFQWILNAVDLNKNGELVLDEIVHYFKHHPNGAWGRDIRYHTGFAFGRVEKYYRLNGPNIQTALVVSIANDTMVYHDVNDNGIITSAELRASLNQWHTVKSRLMHVQTSLKRGLDEVKQEEIDFDVFEANVKDIESAVIDITSKLDHVEMVEDGTATCVGELIVEDARQPMSHMSEDVPYWAVSINEHALYNILGSEYGEGEEDDEEEGGDNQYQQRTEFGQEDPLDHIGYEEENHDGEL